MKALNDKAELKARNKAYKVTLEYCDETCDDVDLEYNIAKDTIKLCGIFNEEQVTLLHNMLTNLSDKVKDVGTRKLRKAFVNYVLDNT